YENKILDGRNRARACHAIGIDPMRREFEGDYEAARAFVISENIKRRHLDESQRAMAAAKKANMRQGERTDLPSMEGRSISQDQAALQFFVGTSSVERAKRVLDSGCAPLIAAVEQRLIKVRPAAMVANFDTSVRDGVVAKLNAGTKAAEAIRLAKREAI